MNGAWNQSGKTNAASLLCKLAMLVCAVMLIAGAGNLRAGSIVVNPDVDPLPYNNTPPVVPDDDPLFTFSFTNNIDTFGSGLLNTTDNGDGSFTAFAGNGVVTSPSYTGPLTLIYNPGGTAVTLSPSGYFIYDNQLFPSASAVVDNAGLLFATSALFPTEVNIYDGPGYIYYDNGGSNTPIEFTITAVVPIPTSLCGGLVLIVALIIVKRTKQKHEWLCGQ